MVHDRCCWTRAGAGGRTRTDDECYLTVYKTVPVATEAHRRKLREQTSAVAHTPVFPVMCSFITSEVTAIFHHAKRLREQLITEIFRVPVLLVEQMYPISPPLKKNWNENKRQVSFSVLPLHQRGQGPHTESNRYSSSNAKYHSTITTFQKDWIRNKRQDYFSMLLLH